jgi:cytidine deaminase
MSRIRTSKRVAGTFPTSLMERAQIAARKAYAPYSGFSVGAAVETDDGSIFSSANMENASYGVTMCAEVGAIQAASAAGKLGKIKKIAIAGGPRKPIPRHRPKAIAPCGRCRQLLAEAARLGGHDIDVWYADLQGNARRHRRISQLLPDAFDSRSLK